MVAFWNTQVQAYEGNPSLPSQECMWTSTMTELHSPASVHKGTVRVASGYGAARHSLVLLSGVMLWMPGREWQVQRASRVIFPLIVRGNWSGVVRVDWPAHPQHCGNNNNNKKKSYVGNTTVLNIAQCFEATESRMNDAFDAHGTDKILKIKNLTSAWRDTAAPPSCV